MDPTRILLILCIVACTSRGREWMPANAAATKDPLRFKVSMKTSGSRSQQLVSRDRKELQLRSDTSETEVVQRYQRRADGPDHSSEEETFDQYEKSPLRRRRDPAKYDASSEDSKEHKKSSHHWRYYSTRRDSSGDSSEASSESRKSSRRYWHDSSRESSSDEGDSSEFRKIYSRRRHRRRRPQNSKDEKPATGWESRQWLRVGHKIVKPTNGPWILKLNYVVPAAVQPKEAPRVRFNKPIVRRRQLRQPQFGSGVEVSKSTETKIADLGTYDYWVVSSYTVTPKPDPDENAHGSAILGPLPRYEKRRILKKVADSDSDESDEKAHSVHGRCEVKAWKQYPILCRRLAAGKADSYSSVYDTDS